MFESEILFIRIGKVSLAFLGYVLLGIIEVKKAVGYEECQYHWTFILKKEQPSNYHLILKSAIVSQHTKSYVLPSHSEN